MLSETEGKFLTMHEFAKAARNRLDANIWDYLTGATETETTMRRNRLALDTLAFRPRVLRDVSEIDTTAEMFGKKLRLPVALAPVGGLESLDESDNFAVVVDTDTGQVSNTSTMFRL